MALSLPHRRIRFHYRGSELGLIGYGFGLEVMRKHQGETVILSDHFRQNDY